MESLLILLHSESNTGYAIAPLERTFYQMALRLFDGDSSRIHFAYPSMRRGPSSSLPEDFSQYLVIDSKTRNVDDFARAARYIRENGIDTVFGFDQPVALPIYRHLRRAGVRHFIAYWGAPMSSIFGPLRRTVKRAEVFFRRAGPDHYIFESRGMADTAVLGRGVSSSRVSVVPLGIDVDYFAPNEQDNEYVYDQIGLSVKHRLFYYAGHMEPRKGVAVIMQAANVLARRRKEDDWHVVLFGNRREEHIPYVELLSSEARSRVTFGGYREDLQRVQRGCYAAIIASTGWDSFPRSALEVQSSGLPLLASDLPGLNETVEDGVSGRIFPVGDGDRLASAMEDLLDDPELRERMSTNARRRAESLYTSEGQLDRLVDLVGRLASR